VLILIYSRKCLLLRSVYQNKSLVLHENPILSKPCQQHLSFLPFQQLTSHNIDTFLCIFNQSLYEDNQFFYVKMWDIVFKIAKFQTLFLMLLSIKCQKTIGADFE